MMVLSWLNIFARAVTLFLDPSRKGDCYTYPVYKLDYCPSPYWDGHTITAVKLERVPAHDPEYASMPWAQMGMSWWSIATSVGCLALWGFWNLVRIRWRKAFALLCIVCVPAALVLPLWGAKDALFAD